MQLPAYPSIKASPEEIKALLSAQAVRKTAHKLYQRACDGQGLFRINHQALPVIVDEVIALMNKRFPDGKVPIHGRWRHLEFQGRDMLKELGGASIESLPRTEKLKVLTELILVSVLLDAGAGMSWSFTLSTGEKIGRSEGLALAALTMMAQGHFSAKGKSDPWRVDAQALINLKVETLEKSFQVSASNPLIGSKGRVELLQGLGKLIAGDKVNFPTGRPGDMFVRFAERGGNASDLLVDLLQILGPMWPGRPLFNGASIGDVWYHPELESKPTLNSFIPFHKLSQWLAYSLLESFAKAGVVIKGEEQLTGLAEYRNGGLLFDGGVLVPVVADWQKRRWMPYDVFTIEWRALTVALLDVIASSVQQKVKKSPTELPLCQVLEAGTWTLGRIYAKERRQDGGPPFVTESDGTLF